DRGRELVHQIGEGDLAVEQCAHDQLLTRRDMVTPLGFFDVLVNGLAADPKQLADIAIAFAATREDDAVELARRQALLRLFDRGSARAVHLDHATRSLEGKTAEILRTRQRRQRNGAARAHAERTGTRKVAGNIDGHSDTFTNAGALRLAEYFLLARCERDEPPHV